MESVCRRLDNKLFRYLDLAYVRSIVAHHEEQPITLSLRFTQNHNRQTHLGLRFRLT